MIAPARMRSRPRSGSSARLTPRPARMKENSPICARLAEIVSAVERRMPNSRTIAKAATDLPITMISTSRARRAARARTIIGSNSMPTETKNSTAKASRSGSVSLRRALAQLGFAQDHAGEEGAERERHVEQHRRAEGDAERDRQHRQAEQLARAGMRDVVQDPRDHAPADDQHDGDEGRDLADGDQRAAAASVDRVAPRRRRL